MKYSNDLGWYLNKWKNEIVRIQIPHDIVLGILKTFNETMLVLELLDKEGKKAVATHIIAMDMIEQIQLFEQPGMKVNYENR